MTSRIGIWRRSDDEVNLFFPIQQFCTTVRTHDATFRVSPIAAFAHCSAFSFLRGGNFFDVLGFFSSGLQKKLTSRFASLNLPDASTKPYSRQQAPKDSTNSAGGGTPMVRFSAFKPCLAKNS